MRRMLQSSAGLAAAPLVAQRKTEELWSPQFLSTEQSQALIAIGERIIPGSAAAQCNRLIDLCMVLQSDEHRQAFVQALAEFDSNAKKQYGKPFQALPPSQQDELLTAASAPHPTPAFATIKEWMADSYWSSQQGLRDLGSNGRMAWQTYPTCAVPEGSH